MAGASITRLALGIGGSPIGRERLERLLLVAGKGAEGDKTFGLRPDRQICLISERSYEWFRDNFGRDPQSLGEQVTISAEIELNWLNLGQRIELGAAALEVATPRAPCKHFTAHVGGESVSDFVGHVGLMCRVVKSGAVVVGDAVRIP